MPLYNGLLIKFIQESSNSLLIDPIQSGFLVFLIGGLSLLMVYHLCLYFQNKVIIYLLYSCYLFFIIISQNRHITSGFLDGVFDYLGGLRYYMVFYTEVTYILYFVFAYRFINVQQEFATSYRYLKIALYIISLYVLVQLTINIYLRDVALDLQLYYVFVVYTLILSIISYILFFKSKSPIKYYLIVGSLLLMVFSIMSLVSFGYVKMQGMSGAPSYLYLYIGFITENIIFSLGLGKQQQLIAHERNKVQLELIEQMKQNEKLEHQYREQLETDISKLKEKLEKDAAERLFVFYEKELAELKLASLRSQMNPHFIFNSLNSIKRFVIENNQNQALFYLNKFSKLVRKILSSSIEQNISLAEEIEIAMLYLNLENIRFDNSIDIDIHIDQELATHAIKVPALILQPFIENAIWHGLSPKKGDKKIMIAIYKKDNNLEFIVEDNGIGRKKAQVLNERKISKQRSYGLRLTEERLRSYSKFNKGEYKLKFYDLVDDSDASQGTRVVLSFPMIFS